MPQQLSVEDIYRNFPTFTEPALQRELATLGRVHHFAEGDVIIEAGGFIHILPLVLSGTIKVSREAPDGAELFLYYLLRGESCTMTFTCCMTRKRSQIRAIAEGPTTILGLPQEKMDEWMMKYKSWKNFVMTAYDRRLHELVSTIDQITFNQLDQRLLHYLHRRSVINDEAFVYTSHQRIADDLYVSREAVSRLLKGMEKQGLISLGRNRIAIVKTLV